MRAVAEKIITKEEAERMLLLDVAYAERGVHGLVVVPLTQGRFDALVSFVFNLGVSRFEKSTLRRLLNTGDYEGAGAQFERWVYAGTEVLPGLVKRRNAERALFDGQKEAA